MSHRRLHWLEKFQVQLAAAAALALVYFAAWRLLRPVDPRGPIVFLPASAGNLSALFVLAAMLALLGAGCAILTISSRPEGALLAALLGVGGLSLRSPSILTLLWREQGHLRGTYGALLLETVLLALAILGAAAAVDVVRFLVSRFRPRWMWRNPIPPPSVLRTGKHAAEPAPRGERYLLGPVIEAVAGMFGSRGRGARPAHGVSLGREEVVRGATHLALGLLLAVVLLTVLLQSADRGQILFAVFVSFAVGAAVAHQMFPTRHSTVAWCMPTLAAVVYYLLSIAASGASDRAWMDLQNYSYILPIDWLTAGGGGSVLGYWISARIHEARHFETTEQQQEKTGWPR